MSKPKYKIYPKETQPLEQKSVVKGSEDEPKVLKLRSEIENTLLKPEKLDKAVSIIKSWIN